MLIGQIEMEVNFKEPLERSFSLAVYGLLSDRSEIRQRLCCQAIAQATNLSSSCVVCDFCH